MVAWFKSDSWHRANGYDELIELWPTSKLYKIEPCKYSETLKGSWINSYSTKDKVWYSISIKNAYNQYDVEVVTLWE